MQVILISNAKICYISILLIINKRSSKINIYKNIKTAEEKKLFDKILKAVRKIKQNLKYITFFNIENLEGADYGEGKVAFLHF